jgi:signal transduction histidine kinase
MIRMSNGQVPNAKHFNEKIERLSREVLDNTLPTPDEVLRRAVEVLADVAPIHTAGVLQMPGSADDEITYSHVQGAESGRNVLDMVLRLHRDLLEDALISQSLLPLAPKGSNGSTTSYFTGLPAGTVGDRLVALGLVSRRELTDTERAQLRLLGRLIGHTADDARIRQMMIDSERQRAVNLIGLIAHELRTPLTGLRGNIQLALMSSRSGKHERIPFRLETAISGVDTMTTLVQSLLDVSRLERGTYHLEPALADLAVTARTAVRDVSSELDPDTQQINTKSARAVNVAHDRPAFERVVGYLLEASVRRSTGEAAIDLQVTGTKEEARIDITYRGEPLSAQERRALTAPLYESPDVSNEQPREALPLQLAFCRGVVVSHGGEITVSEPSGTGEQSVSLFIPTRTNLT